mgnify:CR=1 FL=1
MDKIQELEEFAQLLVITTENIIKEVGDEAHLEAFGNVIELLGIYPCPVFISFDIGRIKNDRNIDRQAQTKPLESNFDTLTIWDHRCG